MIENCTKPSALAFEHAMLRAKSAIDIITDALSENHHLCYQNLCKKPSLIKLWFTVILVPLNMLWRVQISLRRKLGLAGIFSLTVFIMIIAIIRVEVMYDERAQADGTWLWTWSSIEQTVGVCFQITLPSQ